jgi:hypothetical protein
MAAFTTSITERSDEKNRRVWTIDGSTVSKPRLLIQKRKEAEFEGKSFDSLDVVYGTEDVSGTPLADKIVFTSSVRRPNNALAADIAAALAVYRDFINSDEFTQMVTSQDYVL